MRNTHVVLLVLGVVVVSVVGTIAYTGAHNTGANTQNPNYSNLAKLLLAKNLVRFASYNGENLSEVLQTPSIGVVTAMPMEQAPILAAMSVYATVNISGYEFFVGSIGEQQVVSVRSGEKEYAVTTATTLMDTFFNIKAALLSGTAGSRDPNITVGDVVLGAYAVDKSSVHYYLGNSTYNYIEDAYTGVEILNLTPMNNAIVGGFGSAQVVPTNASSYGYGYGADHSYTYVEALPASLGLLQLAEQYKLPDTPISYITGGNQTGDAPSYIVAGVIGSANQWTEPLTWMAQQNALYESDAGENEGMGFAYVNTHFGIPWLIVRGISDSPWYPNTYQGVWAADAAANVTIYIIKHFSDTLPNLYVEASYTNLSPMSNAKAHGYIVADQVYYNGLQVAEVVYTAQNGTTVPFTPGNQWLTQYSYNYTPPNLA
ncbi:MAG TPA: 5'-methylthioadenosine/S-adenosylhomocysteine nucleosidase [Chthonomonas sp.]|uniref:5'-methylthioadenosine/S-adenosylhomocysteine nucleosidase family protein n=1 Tax=Chthonomonas sp. TaxID=2282153 RepID=UPI002B4B4F0F|nr:5'-methylthioadenosine/S-adenosylhomocysteine nucleosidase [Chthonomonas sp.]HLI48439.1 5'-methylthioadenosine/S-adenosylhomocysteine nucleosidase [Chthonomonas sp.]